MGACFSQVDEETQRNVEVNQQLKKDKSKYEQDVKLLFLGAGESGKSTVFKQLRILFFDGFSDDDRVDFIELIAVNIIRAMQMLLKFSPKFTGETLDSNLLPFAEKVNSIDTRLVSDLRITPELGEAVKTLWESPIIQQTYEHRSKFHLIDSAMYYFEALDRIADENYIPSVDDVLRSRSKTTGINEIEFVYEGLHFRVIDVGGQRAERRKWIDQFEDVTAVIFFVAMSEYDQLLFEDDVTNRMMESLELFEEITRNKYFTNTSFILFLNKLDIFMEKIKDVDLSTCFPDYTGGPNYELAALFLEEKFQEVYCASQALYIHRTVATDTENIRFVFKAVRDIILRQNLEGSGLIQ
eukprot:Rmarinus@m.30225